MSGIRLRPGPRAAAPWLVLLAAARAQDSRPASAPAAALTLARRAYPVEPEFLRGASVRLRAADSTSWCTVYLEAPDRARVDPGDGSGHQILAAGTAVRRVPGGGEAPLTDSERRGCERHRAAAQAVLLWPLLDATALTTEGPQRARLQTASGAALQLELDADRGLPTRWRNASDTVELGEWTERGPLHLPQRVVLEQAGARTVFRVDGVQLGWLFEPGFFLPGEKSGRSVGAVDPSGRPVRRWTRLTTPRLLRKEPQTWLVYDDPGSHEARGKELGPVGLELDRCHHMPDGMPLYFREGEVAKVAIPFQRDPKATPIDLPEALAAHRVQVPALHVVALDFQGDPATAESVVPQLMAFCRQRGLEPGGPVRIAPSLYPGEPLPHRLDTLTTRVELPVRQ